MKTIVVIVAILGSVETTRASVKNVNRITFTSLTTTTNVTTKWRKKMRLIEYAKKFIGVEYVWGGNTADEGFDCSGYIQEVLSCVGLDPKGDQTAQMIYDKLVDNENVVSSDVRMNSLLFFGPSVSEIKHVELALNRRQMIGASGEGRTPTRNGTVRVRTIESRRDLIAALALKMEL